MGELVEIYEEVQRLKSEPWEPPAELVEGVSIAIREAAGRPATAAELKLGVDGVGMTGRLSERYDLDWDEMYVVAHAIAEGAERNLRRAQGSVARNLSSESLGVGAGAGFFTGLWMGLLLGERRG